MEVQLDYNLLKNLVKQYGWNCFLEVLQTFYPNLELFNCSIDWYHDKKFICKANGGCGDLIISWNN
jgi:hypothetical protein